MKLLRKIKLLSAGVMACTIGAFVVADAAEAASDKYITIGTGAVTGVYYPTGGAICRLVNRGRKTHNIRCSVESTGGSVYNLNALRVGELDFATVQSDWQFHAYRGSEFFEDQGPFDKLRSLFSLHSEAFTVVARADSGVKKFDDLKGKRVNIGNPGSGMRATMEVLMRAKGWTTKDFKLVSELRASEQPQALCDNKIDVMIYAAGNPNGAVQEATTSCETRIIPIDGEVIQKLMTDNPYYTVAVIPGGMYAGSPDDVKTFGVKATFVTTSDEDEETVYQLVKAVFDNFDNFRTLHPVFVNLKPEDMVNSGNTAPMHKGAARYFKERGWLK